MTADTLNELHGIAERYKKHGISFEQLKQTMETAPEGFTEKAALIFVKMILATEYGETEYITIADVSEATGEPPETIKERIAAMGIDTKQIIPGLFT